MTSTAIGSVYERDGEHYISIQSGEVTSKRSAKLIPFKYSNVEIYAPLEPHMITDTREDEETGQMIEYQRVGIHAFSEYNLVASTVSSFIDMKLRSIFFSGK